MLLKFLNHVRMLRASREKGTVIFQNHHIMFFSGSIGSDDVKRELRRRKRRTSEKKIWNDEKLLVICGDSLHFFGSPTEPKKLITALQADAGEEHRTAE